MADLGDTISKIEGLLKKRGFKTDSSGIQKGFAWKPDLIFTRKNETHAFLLRQTNSVPISLIERLASTKSRRRNLFVNIVFLAKPTRIITNTLKLYGIGVRRLDGGKLVEEAKSKNFLPSKEPRKTVAQHKKMMKTEIFISSKQKASERDTAWKIIEDIRNGNRFPIYPFKVEDNPRFGGGSGQTKKCIDEGLERCEWFVGILSDDWRKWVEYEVQQAIKNKFEDEDITIYVKSTKKTEIAWKQLLNWIKGRNIKYLPFTDVEDLQAKLNRRILGKIELVHKKLDIPMYDL